MKTFDDIKNSQYFSYITIRVGHFMKKISRQILTKTR